MRSCSGYATHTIGGYLEKQLKNAIMGAITDAINQHGAITKDMKESLAKRIIGALKSESKKFPLTLWK